MDRSARSSLPGLGSFVWLSLIVLAWSFPAHAQSAQPQSGQQSRVQQAAAQQSLEQRAPGSIYGTVVDQTGAALAGARVMLTSPDSAANQETQTGDDGQFSFGNISPGPFQVTIAALRFATQTISGDLHSSESYVVPTVTLDVATVVSTVEVTPSRYEVAELQLKEQEQQRFLGFIPNFYVTYIPNAVALSPKQKFKLALRSTVDPVNIGIVAATAGIEQASNQFGGYGQGADGYGKRFGATYADFVTGTFIGAAILPSLLKQDPRYFYKGTGSTRSRALYAIANAVICKGDNGRWQPSYSAIMGSLAAGGISNLYYPPNDRNGAGVTFENTLIGIGESAASNLLQEFVVKKFTPNLPNHGQNKP